MREKLVWLFWLLPLAVIGSSFFVLGSDATAFLRWWLAFFLLGIVFLPLSAVVFKGSRDGGYLFSKPIALALATFTLWTLSYLHILSFRMGPILLVIIGFAIGILLSGKARQALAVSLKKPGSIRLMALEETLFASAMLFWSFVRGLKPLVDSLEKPMDYGFMMSLMRTDFLPAKDMWFSQGNINYYYYGQYVYTFLTKLTGMQPDITYNLSVAATFALTLSLSFALCYLLVSYAMRRSAGLYGIAPAIGGGIGAFLVTVAGNSHSFFYGTGHPGNGILIALQNSGWLARLLPAASGVTGDSEPAGINIADFWFANSTRFIGYNPPTHDKTIHEFPYYSFLVADLHAHLINLAFVLLFIALLAVLLHSSALASAARGFWRTDTLLMRNNDRRWFHKELATSANLLKTTLRQPVFLLCGLLLGIFLMCNFWDFAIYLVVISMTLLVINLRGFGKLGTWDTIPVFLFQVIVIMLPFLLISDPVLAVLGFALAAAVCFGLLQLTGDAFTITGAQISLLFLVSHLLTLPFNLNFEPMSKSMSFSFNHTPLFQFLVLWGPHLLVGLLFLLYILRRRSVEKNDVQSAAVRSRGKVTRFLAGMNPMDLFVCGLLVCGFIFLVLPEVVYVVDIYSGDYKRANTMFKFTYQAFVMLSLGIGYAVARMSMTKKTASRFDSRWSFVSIGMILLLVLPAYYPFVSTKQWMGAIKIENYKGLNGLNGLDDPDRLEAIRWINETIQGQPVILESYGDSYTEYDRISAYTGLPTVMGWQTHEWLWRTSRIVTDGYGQVVKPRQADVQTMYEFQDESKAKSLFKEYQVEYIVISGMEKSKFPAINVEKLTSLGTTVFHNSSIDIIRVSAHAFD